MIFKKGHIPWNKGIKDIHKGKNNPMYGKHHSEEAKKKMRKAKENYNPWEHFYNIEEIKKKISEGVKKHHWTKLGYKHPMLGKHLKPETIKKIREARKQQRIPKHHTKPEMKLLEIIEKHNLPFKYVGNGKFWIENINPDFVECNGKKIAIDVFGRMWHDPKVSFLKNIPYCQTEKGRKEILNKYGWKLIIFWEDELNEVEILKKLKVA